MADEDYDDDAFDIPGDSHLDDALSLPTPNKSGRLSVPKEMDVERSGDVKHAKETSHSAASAAHYPRPHPRPSTPPKEEKAAPRQPVPNTGGASPPRGGNQDANLESNRNTGKAIGPNHDTLHKYRLSVDLRSLSHVSSSSPLFFPNPVTLQYVYSPPNHSNPSPSPPVAHSVESDPVHLGKRPEDTLIPNGFYSFEFTCTPRNLEIDFKAQPIVIRFLSPSPQRNAIATATRTLSPLIQTQRVRVKPSNPASPNNSRDQAVYLQALDTYCLVRPAGRMTSTIGKIRVIVTLEEFGTYEAFASARPVICAPIHANTSSSHNDDALQQLGYPLAMELEMWRRTEETKLKERWKMEEKERIKALETAFQKQLAMREQSFKSRQEDLSKLEKKLKLALHTIERQEHALKNGENALEEHKKKLHRDYEAQRHETILAVKRLRDQHKHEMSIFKLHNAELNQQNKILKKQIETIKSSKDSMRLNFQRLQKHMDKSQVASLRQTLAEKELEIKEMIQRVEKAENAEKRAKRHLRSCLEEIVRLRKLREKDQEARIKMQEKEVARLRDQYMRRQSDNKARTMRNELMAIKSDLHAAMVSAPLSNLPVTQLPATNQIDQIRLPSFPSCPPLKATSLAQKTNLTLSKPSPQQNGLVAPDVRPDHPHSEEIARLEAERRDLLNSGVYSNDHRILQRLAERILNLATGS